MRSLVEKREGKRKRKKEVGTVFPSEKGLYVRMQGQARMPTHLAVGTKEVWMASDVWQAQMKRFWGRQVIGRSAIISAQTGLTLTSLVHLITNVLPLLPC